MRLIDKGAVALMFTILVNPVTAGAQSGVPATDTMLVRLTLTEAIDRALRNSPEIVRATGAITTSEWSERTAFGAYLPSLSLSSGAGRSSSSRFDERTQTTVTGASQSYSAGLSGSYDLFTGGRRGAELNRSRANIRSAEASFIETRFTVVLETKTAFFNVQRQADLVQVAAGDIARSEQALDAATRRLQVGSATRSDELRARLDLNNAKQSLLNIRTQLRQAAFALGVLVGADGPVGVRVDSLAVPRPLPMSEAEIIRLAEQQSPSVRTAEASVTATRAGQSVARASYLPTLRASTGYDWSNNEATFSNGNTGWNMRLSGSYPLFNNFSRESQVASAGVNLRNAEAALAAAKRQVRADAERALADLRLAEDQIELALEAVTVAQEDLRVNQERYRVGMSTILDLLTS